MKSIKYPLTLDKYGVISATEDLGSIYLDRLVTLLSTHIGQRPMYPEYGTDFGTALFENEGRIQQSVEAAVNTAVKRWMPDVKLIRVSSAIFDRDGKATLDVSIQIPNGTVVQTVIRTAVFRANGTITAE